MSASFFGSSYYIVTPRFFITRFSLLSFHFIDVFTFLIFSFQNFNID